MRIRSANQCSGGFYDGVVGSCFGNWFFHETDGAYFFHDKVFKKIANYSLDGSGISGFVTGGWRLKNQS
jgi:hypothetical protein